MATTLDENISVLIVDDDQVDRMALKRALKGTHFDLSISEAADADTALASIDQISYGCIFLDYNLPGKNGLELTKAIRRRSITVPVLVLTGQGDEQTAVELMKAGASDYLPKSKLSAEVIAHLMRNAIRMHQAEALVEFSNNKLIEKNHLLEKKNKELAQQRQYIYQQNLQLQEASRLKSEFLATMSHELRTPLNAIIGFSQILLSRPKSSLSETQVNMLRRVLANGRALLELINDILAFSKIEAGRLALEPAPLDIVELVNQAVEEVRSLALQKSLTLETETNIAELTVENDALRLRQVLINLLSNAIKFTDKGGVKVYLKALPAEYDALGEQHDALGEQPKRLPEKKPERKPDRKPDRFPERLPERFLERSPDRFPERLSEKELERIVISVVDTGCGITHAERLHIFEPFHQADQKVTRRHPGTGLGLAITHSIVKMMHGDITVSTQVNEGSTFTVEIPRVVTADAADALLDEPMLASASIATEASES